MQLDDFYLLLQIALIILAIAGVLIAVNQAWELLNKFFGGDE